LCIIIILYKIKFINGYRFDELCIKNSKIIKKVIEFLRIWLIIYKRVYIIITILKQYIKYEEIKYFTEKKR
jgi:hypothetical protein